MVEALQIIDNLSNIVLAFFFSFQLISEAKNKKRGSFLFLFSIASLYFVIKAFFVICIMFNL